MGETEGEKKSEAKNEEEGVPVIKGGGLGDQFPLKFMKQRRLEAFKRKANHGTQS